MATIQEKELATQILIALIESDHYIFRGKDSTEGNVEQITIAYKAIEKAVAGED